MALTQGARNKIRSFVQAAKSLLMNEFAAQLQQYYGIRPDGTFSIVEELATKDGSIIQTASLLRERLGYLENTIADKNKKAEAVEQLIREQAFTILNRFAAIRMAEEREIIPITIKKGYNSEGFQVFDQLSGGAPSGELFTRYTWFLNAMFDELSIDLPAVFDRFSPYALLFPSEKVMLQLLDIIDDEELNIYREEGHQPMNLWEEDETIGWIYQYYNSREEISAMRDASAAPRNSRELAVRNQFFTPRYVVQFLVDNSLGRQWFEMNKGQTNLVNVCEYMVKHNHEIFLGKGESIPSTKIVDATYVEYRALKDPREILMLDPACGSMHFGLYCFDLFEQIYIEAWDNHPDLMLDLRDELVREDFIKNIPGYILRYNIHGVDIDPRAIQIAGLSLWLRAQKSYKNMGIQPADRPTIKKSNLVVAEAMPGDKSMLDEFTIGLPGPIGKLVRVIWDKMQLVGETGVLLKIEEELKTEIEIAKQEYEKYKKTSAQTALFDAPEDSEAAKMAAIYGKGQKISKDFFDTAEEEVLKALKNFAENGEGENTFQKLLFAEDTARGFAFIELCRKRYDIIFQNPPFGASSLQTKTYLEKSYPNSKYDLASIFIDRMLELGNKRASISNITTRNIYFLKSYQNWRKISVLPKLKYFIDFGMGVLDAMVETSATILSNTHNIESSFLQVNEEPRDKLLLNKIKLNDFISRNTKVFNKITNSPLCYWLDPKSEELFVNSKKFLNGERGARKGVDTPSNFVFLRNNWESNGDYWIPILYSDYSQRYYMDFNVVVNWRKNGLAIREFGTIRNEKYNFRPGFSWAFRTNKLKPHIVPKSLILYSGRFNATFESEDDILVGLSLMNSIYYDYLTKLSMERLSDPKFVNGVINGLPYKDLPNKLSEQLTILSKNQYARVRSIYNLDERKIAFVSNDFIKNKSLNEYVNKFFVNLNIVKEEYLNDLKYLNNIVFDYFQINREERLKISEIIGKTSDDEGDIFALNLIELTQRIFSILVGGIFGRWDLRVLYKWKQEWSDEDIFKARKHSPFLYGKRNSTLDLILPEFHDKIKEIWEMPYPIETLEECATVSDTNSLTAKLKEVIKYFWPETYGTIEEEFVDHFKVNDLGEIFDKHSKFFDAHLKDYTRNKRISPIYWHLGVPSGKFTIWLYYPKLNENSLYKVLNVLVDPKIKDIAKEVELLEVNGSAKDYNDQKEFLEELQNFKDELLRVAQLPYKPNQDDGVLITAAPLHNLFTHTKWRKSTEACWKKLEKGEYDWAHLAYSIWPDRVANKCKKDLSMAIAHGLEDICEVKPKETKPRKKAGVKVKKQQDLL